MGKYNRGKTIKLSIRISSAAKEKIKAAANNLGISSAGVILFELTKLLKSPPSKDDITRMKSQLTLEQKHFVLTVTDKLMDEINDMSEDYGLKKNILIGYILSNHFENLPDPSSEKDTSQKRIMVQVHENLKKKMMEYSEENYIPLNGLIAYSILQGPNDELPSYGEGEIEQMFTNIPAYIGEIIKNGAEELNLREHFYASLCIYKQFMTEKGRFFEE